MYMIYFSRTFPHVTSVPASCCFSNNCVAAVSAGMRTYSMMRNGKGASVYESECEFVQFTIRHIWPGIAVLLLEVKDVRKFHREEDATKELFLQSNMVCLCASATGVKLELKKILKNSSPTWLVDTFNILWNLLREPCDHMKASWVRGEGGYSQF